MRIVTGRALHRSFGQPMSLVERELSEGLFVALEAEFLDPLGVQPPVEAVAGIAPAIGQRAMTPLSKKGGQAGAVRVMTGEAGSTVAADPSVGTEEILIITVVTLSAQRVARFHEHEPLFVAVIEVAFAAVPVGKGRVNAPVAVTEVPRFVALVARLGGFRGRGSRSHGSDRSPRSGRLRSSRHRGSGPDRGMPGPFLGSKSAFPSVQAWVRRL